MNKLHEILIDFEEINKPFLSRIAHLKGDNIPFAYTVGAFVNNCFKIRSRVLNFFQFNIKKVDKILKYFLIEDIHKLLKKSIYIDSKSVKFIAWNRGLENKITNRILNVPSYSAKYSNEIALDLLTLKSKYNKEYFQYFISLNLKMGNIKLSELKHGAMASCIGALMYAKSKNHKIKGIDLNAINFGKLKSELLAYNRSDVLKMKYVLMHPEESEKRKNFIKEGRKPIQLLLRQKNKNDNLLRILEQFELKDDWTITQISNYFKDLINKTTLVFDKTIDELEKKNINKNILKTQKANNKIINYYNQENNIQNLNYAQFKEIIKTKNKSVVEQINNIKQNTIKHLKKI